MSCKICNELKVISHKQLMDNNFERKYIDICCDCYEKIIKKSSNCAVKEKPLHTAIKHNSTFVWNCAEINKMEIKEQKERLRNELEIAKVELEQKEFFVNWLESQIKVLEIKELLNGKTN